jgi:hypothetical protein
MGFDVYGKAPASETGRHFHNNVWAWHPLAWMCEDLAPDIAKRCNSWHANDGAGLDRNCARKLGKKLDKLVKDGAIYSTWRQFYVGLRFGTCPICHGCGCIKMTNRKTEERGTQICVPIWYEEEGEKTECSACLGVGRLNPASQQHYWLDDENVREFAAFCKDSGGFEIK